jgi:hypothetical protein
MNEPSISNIGTRLTRRAASAILLTLATALAVSSLTAQPPVNTKKEVSAEWPESAPYDAAINAFDAALTQASWDLEFRQRLIKSPTSAKEAVAEIGNITIPASKVIVFYEAQSAKPEAKSASAESNDYIPVQLSSISKSNENVHVFCLPPFKRNDKTKKYKYEDYFMCCYDYWKRQNTHQ